MKCPYCSDEMVLGNLYGDRYALKWLPKDKGLVLGIWAANGIKIGSSGGLARPKASAYVCKAYNKMIIDINNC
jgi:hypothetical protein